MSLEIKAWDRFVNANGAMIEAMDGGEFQWVYKDRPPCRASARMEDVVEWVRSGEMKPVRSAGEVEGKSHGEANDGENGNANEADGRAGKRNRQGYGRIPWQGKLAMAHKVSWELRNGPVPVGLLVRHKCHNPPCCNPEHLELGTQKDNMQDAVKAGRTFRPKGQIPRRLTAEKAAEVRAKANEGTRSSVLARAYGVSWNQIRRIVRGEAWRMV